MVSFDLSKDGYDDARGTAFLEDLRQRVLAMPGVTAAGFASDLPLDLSRSGSAIFPEGFSNVEGAAYIGTDFAVVSAGFFETARVRVSRGRTFTDADRTGAVPVVIVSRTLAERVWPGEEALGRRLRFDDGEAAPLLTVVGIADDVKNAMLMESPEPMTYLPAAQNYRPAMTLLARADNDAGFARALRETVLSVDPQLALSPVQSFAEYTSVGVLPQKLAAGVTGGLGLLALLLSALGIYGVIAYAVAQRTREIGVRMALGARAGDVIRIIVRDGFRLALPGLAFGIIAGLGLAFLIRGFILGVAPVDPTTVPAAPVLLLATVVLASAGPARRAARTEPTSALRSD
jgi:predicted permease